jgi:hypothetical protein
VDYKTIFMLAHTQYFGVDKRIKRKPWKAWTEAYACTGYQNLPSLSFKSKTPPR